MLLFLVKKSKPGFAYLTRAASKPSCIPCGLCEYLWMFIRTQTASMNTWSRRSGCLRFSQNRNYGVNGSLDVVRLLPRKRKTELERYFTLPLVVEKDQAALCRWNNRLFLSFGLRLPSFSEQMRAITCYFALRLRH